MRTDLNSLEANVGHPLAQEAPKRPPNHATRSMLKAAIKKMLFAVAPTRAARIFSARARVTSHRAVRSWGCLDVNRKLIDHFGSSVQAGPFRGLELGPMSALEQVGPFLLGTYESELAPAWEVILRGSYRQILDVGAKFGYYAVGLARRYPSGKVVAFDPDPWAQRATHEMIQLNAVQNVEVFDLCDANWLDTHLSDDALIVSDCEGYEAQLFACVSTSALSTATLLIEVHEEMSLGVTALIKARLQATHQIREIRHSVEPREWGVDLSFLSSAELRLATMEVRGRQAWLLCLPSAGVNGFRDFTVTFGS